MISPNWHSALDLVSVDFRLCFPPNFLIKFLKILRENQKPYMCMNKKSTTNTCMCLYNEQTWILYPWLCNVTIPPWMSLIICILPFFLKIHVTRPLKKPLGVILKITVTIYPEHVPYIRYHPYICNSVLNMWKILKQCPPSYLKPASSRSTFYFLLQRVETSLYKALEEREIVCNCNIALSIPPFTNLILLIPAKAFSQLSIFLRPLSKNAQKTKQFNLEHQHPKHNLQLHWFFSPWFITCF